MEHMEGWTLPRLWVGAATR